MLPEMLFKIDFFKKISFIKKNVVHQNSYKNLISVIYDSFIFELWCLHCALTVVLVLRDKICNTDFNESKNIAVEKNIRVTINFYKKQCFPVIIWNEKIIIEARCTNNMQLFFAAAMLLKVCELFHFRQSKKTCSIATSVCIIFLWISREEKTK